MKSLNRKYCAMYSAQGLLCSGISGYNAYFLTENGYGAGEAGTMIAVFGAITALAMPLFGRIADKSEKFHWKRMLILFSFAEMAFCLMLLFLRQKYVVGPMFEIAVLMMGGMFPMMNVACFYYEKKGYPLDFGIGRGFQSLFYALGAFVLGYLTEAFDGKVVPMAGLVLSGLFLLPVLSLPYLGKAEKEEVREDAEKTGNFLKKYPCFPVLIVGSALVMTVFNLTSTFLIYVVRGAGGDSSHMGIALTIAAILEVPMMMLFRHVVKRIPVTRLLVISGIMYMVKSLVLFFSGSIWMIYAAQLLQPFSYALFNMASVHFAGKYMEPQDATTGQALLSMSNSGGSVIGSLVGGWLIAGYGVGTMLLSGSVIALAATVIISVAMRIYRKEKNRNGLAWD